MKRREFVKLCGSALALVYANPNLLASPSAQQKAYNKALLVDKNGKPLKASTLKTGVSYIFSYPYVGTPAFLIDLGNKVDSQTVKSPTSSYQWPGGVGAKHSIVAFTSICSHQFSYPTKAISFVSYSHGKSKAAERDKVIVCCAHQTIFDPTQGASAISGPTKKPLTTIVLEHDAASDHLHAVATLGDEQFQDFFRAYKRDLIQAYGRGKAKEKVENNTQVVTLEEYSAQLIQC